MALTRPTVAQLNTVVTTISDPITVLNKGSTSANIDIGFLMNRDGGTRANVGLFWNESANSFVTAFTTSSGLTNANISVGEYANLRVNSLTGTVGNLSSLSASGTIQTTGIIYANSSAASTSYSTGALVVPSGGVGIFGALNVGGQASLSSVLVGAQSTGSLFIFQDGSGVNIAYFSNSTGNLVVSTPSTSKSISLLANGTTGAIVNGNGAVSLNSTISSSSTTTGALVVSGGVGVAGSTYTKYLIVEGEDGVDSAEIRANLVLNTYGSAIKITPAYPRDAQLIVGSITQNTNPSITLGNPSSTGGNPTSSTINFNTGLSGTPAYIQYTRSSTAWDFTHNSLNGSINFSTYSSIDDGLKLTISGTQGNVKIYSNAQSTSKTTGALVINGGLGVGGNVTANNIVATTATYTGNVITGNVITSNIFYPNGAAFQTGGGTVSLITSNVAPTSPSVGTLWYDTTTDIIFQYSYDGVSNVWIDISSDPITSVSGNTNKNLYTGLVTATTSATLVDTLPIAGNTMVGWTLTSTDNVNSRFKSSMVNSINDGSSNVYYTEYAVILSNSNYTVATFTSNITAGNINLYAVGDSSNVYVAYQRVILGSSTTTGYVLSGERGATGNTGATGNIANTASPMVSTNTTSSTSYSTGALKLSGGLGVAGNISVKQGQQITVGIEDPNANIAFPERQIVTVANANVAAGINVRNLSGGTNASSNFIAVADNNQNDSHYTVYGIAGSGYNVGSLVTPYDAYIAVTGGNLLIVPGTSQDTVIADGSGNILARFRSTTSNVSILANATSTSTTTGALTVAGGLGVTGNIWAGGNISAVANADIVTSGVSGYFIGNAVGTTASYTGNVTTGNISVTSAITANATITSNGNLNATAFAVVGSGAVSNVALGFFPPAGTPAEMAIRDYSAANSTMYFDSTIGSANVGGNFQFRGTSSFTQYAKIDRYGITLPTRPAFRVNGTGIIPQTLSANVNLKGAAVTTIFNQGGYFDATTGKFTAPVAGIYNVTLVARVGTNNGLNQIAVLKNGANSSGNVVCFWETDTNTGTASHFGTCGTVILAVGDYLSANILSGNISFDGNDNWTVTYIG